MARRASRKSSAPSWLTANMQTIIAFNAGLVAAGLTITLVASAPTVLNWFSAGETAAQYILGGALPALQAFGEAIIASVLAMAGLVIVFRSLGLKLNTRQALSVTSAGVVFGGLVMAGAMVTSYYMYADEDLLMGTILLSLAFVASGAAFATAWKYGLRTVK